jgi:hypothetical protein
MCIRLSILSTRVFQSSAELRFGLGRGWHCEQNLAYVIAPLVSASGRSLGAMPDLGIRSIVPHILPPPIIWASTGEDSEKINSKKAKVEDSMRRTISNFPI